MVRPRDNERMELGIAVEEKEVRAIQRLGLTEYESRAYLALVKMGPIRASDLSYFAQVPRTKIYGAIKELERKALLRVIPGKPELYSAVSPRDALMPVLTDLERRLEDSVNVVLDLNLKHEANSYVKREVPTESSEFWEIKGRPNLLNKMNEVLRESTCSIYYATTAAGLIRAYKAQADILEKATRKGVQINLLAQMSSENRMVADQFREFVSLKILDRPFNANFISVDSQQLIVIDSRPDDLRVDRGSDFAVWTTSKLIVDLHEQFFERVWNDLPQETRK